MSQLIGIIAFETLILVGIALVSIHYRKRYELLRQNIHLIIKTSLRHPEIAYSIYKIIDREE